MGVVDRRPRCHGIRALSLAISQCCQRGACRPTTTPPAPRGVRRCWRDVLNILGTSFVYFHRLDSGLLQLLFVCQLRWNELQYGPLRHSLVSEVQWDVHGHEPELAHG